MENLSVKHYDHLVITQALFLFYNNFHRGNIIEEMKAEDSGFNHAWTNLYENARLDHKKNGGMFVIRDTEVYNLVNSKLTYKGKALLIEKVLNQFGGEVKKQLDFSIEIDLKVKETRSKKKIIK